MAANTGLAPWHMADVDCSVSFRAADVSSPYPDLLFEDDFSSGDFSKHNDFFRWGHGSIISPGTLMGYPEIGDVTGPLGTTIKALMFRYKKPDDWPERRFHLTDSVDEVRGGDGNGPGLTHHREVWIAFDFFAPADMFHDDIPAKDDNNKLWVSLWKNHYGHSSGAADVWASVETYPTLDGAGTSYVQFKYSSPNGSPNRTAPDFRAPEYQIPSSDRAYAIPAAQRGTWARHAIGVRCADPGAANGWFRVYRDGVRVIGFEGVDNSNLDPALNGFDRGYLMGWANAGYTNDVTFLIANFACGLTPEAVGITA